MASSEGTEDTGQKERQFSDAEIAAIAKQVGKNLKAKELRGIGATLAKSLKPADYLAIGKGLGKSPWVIGPTVIALILAGLFVYKTTPHWVQERADKIWNAQITNEVKHQFEETRISNIVVSVAGSEASNLMAKAVSPEITKFEKALDLELEAVRTNVEAIHKEGKAEIAEVRNLSEQASVMLDGLKHLQRTIPREKRDEVINFLKQLPKATIHIFNKGTTSEATYFSKQLLDIFQKAGFETDLAFDSVGMNPVFGERIHVKSIKTPPACAGPIQSFMKTLGFVFEGEESPGLGTNEIHLNILNKSP